MLTLLALAALAQDSPFPKPSKEHEWLGNFAGEWVTDGEAAGEPGRPPAKLKGTATGRSLGGFWAVLENRGEAFGKPFTGVLTLGWDVEAKAYHGTWIDSLSAQMWRYTGKLEGNTLTLETTGPCLQTGKVEKFQEKIELQGKDAWIFTSGMFVDGKLQQFLKMTYTRKS